jgi:K+-sensing histidine kinase KdpD
LKTVLPLTHLLSAISHELRSPLTSLKGTATLLVDHHDRFEMKEIVAFLDAIDRETDRLTDLLDDLVTLARSQIGALRLQRGWYSLGEVLAPVLEQNCQLQNVPPHADVMAVAVWVDRRRIQHALGYLVDLVQATRPESVAAHRVPVWISAGVQNVLLQVGDADAMLTLEHAAQQLAQVDQLDDPVLRREAQPVLRWLLSQAVVELHGGQVWIEAQPAPARLCVALPRVEVTEVE